MLLCRNKDYALAKKNNVSALAKSSLKSNHDELILFTKNLKCAIVDKKNEIFNSSEV